MQARTGATVVARGLIYCFKSRTVGLICVFIPPMNFLGLGWSTTIKARLHTPYVVDSSIWRQQSAWSPPARAHHRFQCPLLAKLPRIPIYNERRREHLKCSLAATVCGKTLMIALFDAMVMTR